MKEAESVTFNLTLTGHLALDFANTVDWRGSEDPQELLKSYADLVSWGQHAGAIAKQEARQLLREALRRRGVANGVVDRAIELRETIFRIFSAAANGLEVDDSDLAYLNRKLSAAMPRLKIGRRDDKYDWEWSGEGALERILWPVVRAAAELLTSADLQDIRECPGAGCRWLFVDKSRNRSRRWCSMEVCGNRAKARRHYQHTRSEKH
jgi:predicted RNA-binding Zn ribbon-like protein